MNPLVWFRENQKSTVAFFTVLLMGGFGALGVLSSVASNNSGPAPTEAKPMISWSGGTLTDVELEEIWRQRRIVQNFQYRLQQALNKNKDNRTFVQGLTYGNVSPEREGSDPRITRQTDAQTLEVILLEKEADRLGISATDDVLMNTITTAVGNLIPDEEIRRIAQTDVGVSLPGILRLMRREFKAQAAQATLNGLLLSTSNSPAEAFMAYDRLNRKADCSVLGLEVSDYMKKVTGTPSDAELKELFEKGRYRAKAFDGETPGFRSENKLSFGYFQADIEAITARFAKDVTDEDAKKEYDRLVEIRDPLVYVIKKVPENPLGPVPSKDAENNQPGSGLPLTAPGTDAAKSDLPPMPKSTKKSSTEKKADSTKEQPETKKEETKKEDKVSQARPSSVQYVSIASKQEEKKAEAGEKKQEEKKTEQKAEVNNQKTEAKKNEGDQKSDPKKEEANKDNTKKEEPKDEIRPFEEVKEKIKQNLAGPKATKYVEDSFRTIKVESIDEMKYSLLDYKNDLAEAERTKTEKPTKPEGLDFDAIVKNYDGISFQKTPAMTFTEFVETEIGKRFEFSQNQQTNIARIAFLEQFQGLSAYETIELFFSKRDLLLFVLDKSEAGVVDFETAKDSVMEFWKSQQAFKLAMADAEKKAKEIKDQGKKLLEVFEEGKETGSFSWYVTEQISNGFRSFPQVRNSQPNNTEFVGTKFLEKVFTMKVGEVSVAPNQSKEIVYVIQKNVDSIDTDEARLNSFMEKWVTFQRYPEVVRTFSGSLVNEGNSRRQRKFLDRFKVKFLN